MKYDHVKKQSWRKTPIREAILEIFASAKTPLTSAEIQKSLNKSGYSPNKTTVYREIDFLQSENVIEEFDFGDRVKRYELASRKHHHHLVCVECDDVEDVNVSAGLEAEGEKIAKTRNFAVKRHSLEFFGICKNCLGN